MTGTSKKNKRFQCFIIYALGGSPPIANTPTVNTTRVNSRVINLISSGLERLPHERGSKRLAP